MTDSEKKLPEIPAPPKPALPGFLNDLVEITPLMPGFDKEKFKRVVLGSDFHTMNEAVAADVFDAVPVLGDVSNFLKLFNVKKDPQLTPEQQRFMMNLKQRLHTVDFIGGAIPGVGTAWDLATPTNTIIYLIEKKHLGQAMRFLGMDK